MALSRIAKEFAAEIKQHDWSDAPYRIDRAGHQRDNDRKSASIAPLSRQESDFVRTNVMWVTAQVLNHADPNFDVGEFAVACGIPSNITHRSNGQISGALTTGLRIHDGVVAQPGTWDFVSKSAN